MSQSQDTVATLDGSSAESAMINPIQSAPTSSTDRSIETRAKIKDLVKLLSKCKESLKLKNAQIQKLKDSLGEVEKFKDFNESLKRELAELREAHETWTVSIAESKRILHQEIEYKNAEMETIKSETNDLQLRLTDSHNKARQLKLAIQDLESRLVCTSAAHQRERENLTKELVQAKNIAIHRLQREHEINLERVKVDLERSMEALKLDILNRDEQIIRDAGLQQHLQTTNQTLRLQLEECNQKLNNQSKILDQVRDECQGHLDEISKLKGEIETLRAVKPAVGEDKTVIMQDEELAKQVETLVAPS